MTDAEYIAGLEAALTDDLRAATEALCDAWPDASGQQITRLIRKRFPEVWEKHRATIFELGRAKNGAEAHAGGILTSINMQTMRKILENPAACGLRCVLCLGLGTVVTLYFPYTRTRKRLRISRDQAIGYALCPACNKRPDRIAAVEAYLHSQLTVQ